MIKPTIGRVVWVENRPGRWNAAQPEVALICYVHNDTCVNVAGFDASGEPFKLSSLPLLQDGDEDGNPHPDYPHAQWMPYQKGQAAKTEALERQVGAGG